MSVTSGFFNSLNHDRRYSAQQMSAIFDGIINDGVFANIGVAFAITADSGVTINIGVGKAWFNSAWVYNDALLPKTLEGSEVVLDRIDAVVIEVDHSESVRMGDIKIVKGSPSSSPKNPTMANTTNKHQYPLAYIYRKAGSTEITQADITNMVGTSSCPYITGILQVQNIDNIVAQWNAQWNQWYAEKIAETDTDASELLAEMKSEFDIWFNDIQALLEDDVATALAAQVAELQGKFDTLAREGAVYDAIEDSDFGPILGSDGTPIQGKTVLGGGCTNVSKPSDIGAVAVDGTTPMKGPLDMNNHRVQNVSEPEVDTDATNAGYVKKATSRASSPHNLLDNSDFRNPVNQRGKTTLGPGSGYFIDRWTRSGSAGTFSVTESGLTIETSDITRYSDIVQTVGDSSKLTGKAMTFAVKFVEYGTVILNFTFGTSKSVIKDDVVSIVHWDSKRFYIRAYGAAGKVTVEWAALYEGTYTEETLPEYRPKGYGAELMECMRYYQRFTNASGNAIAYGYTVSETAARAIIPTSVPLRSAALSIDGSPSFNMRGGGKSVGLTSATPVASTGNIIRIDLIGSGLPVNEVIVVYPSGDFGISADL